MSAASASANQELRETADDAVAVVGLSCRLPGAATAEEFWRLLRDGRDALSEPPADRADLLASGQRFRGGFLEHVDRFDPDFFGISPREAATTDPQQRLALELAWEALEDAGLLPGTLRDSRTGVFFGAIWDDYAKLAHDGGPDAANNATLAGVSRGVIANRVSYALGLQGPSLVVDSGQSSSLVAVHLACESLLKGETGVALAGGVSLNLLPDGFLLGEKFGALSPEGRAYTFDERANGYVRGEGGGVVVLKTLRQAVADGDPIRCVIRGGAVNNDGSGPSLTAPSAAGQEAVLRDAYQRAGVDPAEVRYVELHGTGTPAGDPVEAAALGAVLGGERRAAGGPLLVGSVKTNIGHLEGAAGIAGLIKTALCLEHGTLVPSLNYRTPNPRIPLEDLRIEVNGTVRQLGEQLGEPLDGPERRPVVAGVSSFGMGGTNCHLVLASWIPDTPATPSAPAGDPGTPLPVLVSGRTPDALRAQAGKLADHLAAHPDQALPDVAYSLTATRSRFEHRAVVLASGRAGLVGELARLADGGSVGRGA
ncbi:polyketide synthase, partial [Streptomyces sp. B1866]|nr:polyketide synthase [Streptomyces sp. B1866]